MLFSSLKKIDLFGTPIQLTFQSQYKYKTATGACITMLMGVICVVAIYFFGKEVLIRENPVTIFDQEFSEEPSNFPITSQTFPFALGIQDGNTWTHFIDETIYTVSAVNVQRTRVLNKSTNEYYTQQKKTPIQVGPCNVDQDLSKIQDTKEYFHRLDVRQMYCIKEDSNFIPSIQGNFDSENYFTVILYFSQCQNSTANNNSCKPKEEIDRKLNASFFAINYVDSTVNQRDPVNPYRYFGKDQYTFTTNLMRKNIAFFLKHVVLKSDEGWLFEDIKQNGGIAFNEWREMLDIRAGQIFLQFTIRLDSKISVYSRQYKKIQNVMAEVGGFLKFILVIAIFLIMPLTKLNFYTNLLNEIFVFKSNSNKQNMLVTNQTSEFILKKNPDQNYDLDKIPSQKIIQQSTSTALNTNQFNLSTQKTDQTQRKTSVLAGILTKFLDKKRYSNSDAKAISETEKNNQSKDINQVFKIQTGGLRMTSMQYILYYLCPCRKERKKQKYIFKTIKKVKSNLDAVFLLNKLNELDKLKMLLLTPNQIRLFNLLQKPLINIEEDEIQEGTQQNLTYQYNSIFQERKNQLQKVSEAFKAYQQLDETQLCDFDRKLIEFLDPNIREIFFKAKMNINAQQKKVEIKNQQIIQEKQENQVICEEEINEDSESFKSSVPIEIDSINQQKSMNTEKIPKLFSQHMIEIQNVKKHHQNDQK